MTFISGSSRRISGVDVRTPEQLRAALAFIYKSLKEDKDDLDELDDIITTLLGSLSKEALASEAITAGQILRLTADDTVALARANAVGTSDVVGAALEDIASGTVGKYVPLGLVKRDSWGLTRGSTYFLSSSTAGEVAAAPVGTADGNVILAVGTAYTSELLYFNPAEPIIL